MIASVSGAELVQQLINALSLGSTYALLALGLAMVFSILGLVNFAFGELVTVAGYTMYLLQTAGVPFGIEVPAAIAAAALASVAMERLAFRPLRGASFATLLFSSFALSVIIQNLFLMLVSPREKGVSVPDFFNKYFHVGAYHVGYLQVITAASCVTALLALSLFLRRSTSGVGMLAAAQDFDVSRLMGIRSNRVVALAFALSGALAGVAAIFIVASRGTVSPQMGFNPVLSAFIAIVIGGLGSLSGAVLGGFLLAFIEVALQTLLPSGGQAYVEAVALVIVIGILYVRPEGLLTRVAEA
jgi:branched-chain amino acid transport system permease protein